MPNNDAIPMNVVEVLASAELSANDNSESVAMSVAEGGAGSSRKADKVSGATAGNLAGLDATGNLTDSGKKPADFVAAENFYATQLPMSSMDPTTVAEKATDLLSHIDETNANLFDATHNRWHTDNVPYNIRKSGGEAKAYDWERDTLVGGTVAWNQNLGSGNAVSTYEKFGVTFTAISGKYGYQTSGTYSYSSGDRNAYVYNIGAVNVMIAGHKYCVTNTSKYYCAYVYGGAVGGKTAEVTGNRLNVNNQGGAIISCTASGGYQISLHGGTNIANDTVMNETIYVNVFDLTAMFGSTIADYIYTIEQATAGSGVSWFRKLFPNPYYAYDAGTLMSVNAEAHKTVGFNQWDEQWEEGNVNVSTGGKTTGGTRIRSKNYVPILPNTSYCTLFASVPSVGTTQSHIEVYYDADKNYISGGWTNALVKTTPPNAYYMMFATNDAYGTTYTNDICINISDVSKNGQYEPYSAHTYALGNVELRGIPKLDSNNNLYYDGDVYKADGSVTRKYALVQIDPSTLSNNGSIDQYETYKVFWHRPNGAYTLNVICNTFADYITGMTAPYMNVRTTSDGIEFSLLYSMIGVSAGDDDNSVKLPAAKTWFTNNPVYVVYELVTPTTDSSDPFTDPQAVNAYGTEEYIDRPSSASPATRDVAIHVGHETKYVIDPYQYIEEKTAELQALILEG